MEITQQLQPERKCKTCLENPVVPLKIGMNWIYPADCPACKEEQFRKAILHQQRKEAQYRSAITDWHIAATLPKCFQFAYVHHLPEAMQKEFHALPKDKGLFLFGPVGCGKSYAMAALARELIITGQWPVELENWERLLNRIRSYYHLDSNQAERLMEKTMKARTLFIDDLCIGGSESDFAMKTLYTILDYRIEQGLRTFFASNRSPEEVGEIYDQRILSRIKAHCQILYYEGPDRRIQSTANTRCAR